MCYVVIHDLLDKCGEKVNKTVYACNSKEQAEIVIKNVSQVIGRKNIQYRPTKPNYNLIRYNVKFIDVGETYILDSINL